MNSNNKTLKISIITVVKNGEEHIENNILSLLNQTYKNYEHIIIDGNSNDNTKKIKYENTSKFNSKRIYSR
jgi:glycosyltransferase involved in cell wall biosynthesis